MWNENAPLELLKEMPHVLTIENLSVIQEVIDKDKFINSQLQGCDLCGSYAPFCNGCDKSVQYPCAVSYVKMKQNEGMDVEIEELAEEPVPEEPVIREEQEPVRLETVAAPKSSGTKIRIAIARKKK